MVTNIKPVRIDRQKMAGLDLTPGESPVPEKNVLSGKVDAKRELLFEGNDIEVRVFESTPAKVLHKNGFTFDEFVHILSGSLILTDSSGEIHEFTAGDTLVVPTGFSGTWEMLGNYRELIVIKPKPQLKD